ncbi:MAG: IS3 family transposase [Fidelibacterota bacterium]
MLPVKKKTWGPIEGQWVPHEIRDELIDFCEYWSTRTQISVLHLLKDLELSQRKYYKWKKRYSQPNQPNAPIPKGHWLEEWEREAILFYHREHPWEGYRRLTFMMLDENVVAVSPSSVYRILKNEGLLQKERGDSKKGSGFKQPLEPHEHWHIDISYLNLCGTFYYLCSVLDGCSRYTVHWEI